MVRTGGVPWGRHRITLERDARPFVPPAESRNNQDGGAFYIKALEEEIAYSVLALVRKTGHTVAVIGAGKPP